MTAKSFTGSRDDLRAKIKDMRAAGDSASVIGLALGISRCAVLGHVNRMGLPTLAGAYRKAYVSTKDHSKPKKLAPVLVAPEPPAGPISLQLTIEQLSNRTCRYPEGEAVPFLYCGNTPHADNPYCEHHCRVAWSKPHAATQFKGRSTMQFHR